MASITAAAWMKITAAIGAAGIAAPALIWKALPTGENLKARYPEDNQPHLVRERHRQHEIFDDYVTKLKEYSKDDRNIWIVMQEEQAKARKAYKRADAKKQRVASEELAARRAEIRREVVAG